MFANPPGHPGIIPHWTSSANSGVGAAINRESRVWFTISHGIIDEVYHPFIDRATMRDFEQRRIGLIRPIRSHDSGRSSDTIIVPYRARAYRLYALVSR